MTNYIVVLYNVFMYNKGYVIYVTAIWIPVRIVSLWRWVGLLATLQIVPFRYIWYISYLPTVYHLGLGYNKTAAGQPKKSKVNNL